MLEPRIYRVSVFEDLPATFLARMEDLESGALMTQGSLAAITYKIFDISGVRPDNILSSGVVVISTAVFNELKIDNRWKRDKVGFNFVHTLPGSAFPTGIATLLLEYSFTPVGSLNPAYGLFFVIKVIKTRSLGAITGTGQAFGQGAFGQGTAGGSQ